MRAIIGYGNTLRGEDAFGIDVISELKKYDIKSTKLISTVALTPELVLELLHVNEIIFVDACYDEINHYALACSTALQHNANLSHQLSPQIIIAMLSNLYHKHPKIQIYSMLTNSFENIQNTQRYHLAIQRITKHLHPYL